MRTLVCIVFVFLSAQFCLRAQCIHYSLAKEHKIDTTTAFVNGKVSDPWGHGMAFVTVKIGSYQVQTNELGDFSFPGISTGKYTVEVSGYCFSTRKRISLKAGYAFHLKITIPKQDEHLPGLGIPGKN